MRDAGVGQRRVLGYGIVGDVRVLDDLEDSVVVVDPDDRRPQDHGRRHELAHVALDGVALHAIRRRQKAKTENLGVPTHRLVHIGNADGGVGDSGEHSETVGAACHAMLPAMSEERDVVTVERHIEAPPEAIFGLLVDPDRHRDIDGSGTVRDPKGQPQPLAMGTKFGMSMRMAVPYSMVSTVIEYEQNRRLAWQTTGPGALGGAGRWPNLALRARARRRRDTRA